MAARVTLVISRVIQVYVANGVTEFFCSSFVSVADVLTEDVLCIVAWVVLRRLSVKRRFI